MTMEPQSHKVCPGGWAIPPSPRMIEAGNDYHSCSICGLHVPAPSVNQGASNTATPLTTPEGTELDQILNTHRSETWNTGWNNDATEKAKAAILQWHTTLVEQAVLEARIDELNNVWASHNSDVCTDLEPKGEETTSYDRIKYLKLLKSQQAGKETDT